MNKIILAAILVVSSAAVMAEKVTIERHELGSGQENTVGAETAQRWDNSGLYHAPQYMPYHPTAATLYPRVVELPCVKDGETLNCDGYNWSPDFGRAEYVLVRPVLKNRKPKVIHVEVPRKRKGE